MTQTIKNISFKGTKTTSISYNDDTIAQNPKARSHRTQSLYDNDCCKKILWTKPSDINPFKTMRILGDKISLHFKNGTHIESTPTFIKQSVTKQAKDPDGTPIKITQSWYCRPQKDILVEKVQQVNEHLREIAKKVSLLQKAKQLAN